MMLASRVVRPASFLARPFSSSAAVFRAPSIRDITADSASEFNARQKEFRENLEVARKRKEQQERDEQLKDQSPKRGPLSSLIYGTKEGQQLDKDIERSFSQVLARGKYVHSIVFHEVKPDKVDEYVDLISTWYPRMAQMEENKLHLVGSWRTQVGDNDTFGKAFLSGSCCSRGPLFANKAIQSTFGSTSDTMATIPHCIASRNTRNSPNSTAS
jgi:hypothetical protein